MDPKCNYMYSLQTEGNFTTHREDNMKMEHFEIGMDCLRDSPNAGSSGSIPGQGTRSHMPQLKILHAATKIQHSHINK